MGLRSHAEIEMAHWIKSDDEMSRLMAKQLLEIVDLFASHGHSGFSAGIAISTLEKLLRQEPLGPITGEDDEWVHVAEQDGYPLFQNRRCSHVFKCNGEAYDIDGKIFRDPNGTCFTNGNSRVPVTFPYTPNREYVDVE